MRGDHSGVGILSLQQWESYYQGGALATGPTGADGSYDQEIRQVWSEFFARLPAGSRILDVGTGNGVVALIAKQTAASLGLDWEIHATDLAQIDPSRYVADGARRMAGIQFHAGVATEHLPFADASMAAVSGHYALEYSDTAAALAQIHRVLQPGSAALFIMHSSDSALVRNAQWSMRETDLVLKQTKIYRRLHRLVSMEQVSAATQHATDELRTAIQTLKRALPQAQQMGAGHILSVALDAVQKLLSARTTMRPQAVGLEVDRAEEQLRTSWRRLNDLVDHARSAADMAQIQAQAAGAGFTEVRCDPQYHAGSNLVGWRLSLLRP